MRVIVLDRDGVINAESADYVRDADEWHPLPGSLEAIARLHEAGYRVFVVTNQAGIGRGIMSEDAVLRVHARMREAVEQAGGVIAGIQYCPHSPDQGCECRKPRPGMLRKVEQELGCSLRDVPFVGDKISDIDAALAAGARPVLVLTGYGKGTLAKLRDAGRADDVMVYPDLAGFVSELLEHER
jgi:D-glycero-D-manno-heptose 1,7-bisphosphate phosphatase